MSYTRDHEVVVMLTRFRRVVRGVGSTSSTGRVIGVGSKRRARGRGGDGRADRKLHQAHVQIQGDGPLRNDRAILRVAVAALAVGDTLAVRSHVAVTGAVGDYEPRWWCHGPRWRCGRRGRRGRQGWQRRRRWRLWRGGRRRRWRLCATENARLCNGRVLIAPAAPSILEAKVFGVEGKARGTPSAIVNANEVHSGALRVDQL